MPFDPSHKIYRRCIFNLFSEELVDFEGLGICELNMPEEYKEKVAKYKGKELINHL